MINLNVKESTLEGYKNLDVHVNGTTVSYGLVRHGDLEEILDDLQKDIDNVNKLKYNSIIDNNVGE